MGRLRIRTPPVASTHFTLLSVQFDCIEKITLNLFSHLLRNIIYWLCLFGTSSRPEIVTRYTHMGHYYGVPLIVYKVRVLVTYLKLHTACYLRVFSFCDRQMDVNVDMSQTRFPYLNFSFWTDNKRTDKKYKRFMNL